MVSVVEAVVREIVTHCRDQQRHNIHMLQLQVNDKAPFCQHHENHLGYV